MASEEDVPGCSNSSSDDSPSQEVQATLPASSQSPTCPLCHETITDEASVSWCRHVFCFTCIMEVADVKTICPVCQETFEYVFHKVGDKEYEVYKVVPCRRVRRRVHLSPIPELWLQAPSDTWQRESSVDEEISDQAGTSEQDESDTLVQDQSGAPEQDRSRAPEQQQQDGHSRDQQAPLYSTRRSWRQTSWSGSPRPQRAIPAASVRRQPQRRAGRDFSTDQHESRSRSRGRLRSRRSQAQLQHSRGPHSAWRAEAMEPHSAPDTYRSRSRRGRQEELRVGPGTARHQRQSRRDGAESPAPRAQRHVPASSERALSRQRHARASSGRRERRQRGGRSPSRQGHAARSRSRSRSQSRRPARRRTRR